MKSQIKSLLLFWLSSSTLYPAVEAATTSLTDLIPLIPPCALSCIVQVLSEAPDALANPTSTCRNETLQAPISKCVQLSCNFTEQAQVGIVNSKLCEGVPPDDSRLWALFIVAIVFGPLALLTIAVRTYSRYAITKQMGGDDWTMIAAGAVMIGVLACNFKNQFENGFGRHYWNLDPTRITKLLQIFYAAEIFYIVEVTLVKVSILQFYLRVFPTKWFRIADIVTLVLVVAAGIGILIPIFLQCTPINGAWDRSITNTKCININLLAYATGGIGVGLDIIILALPVPELVKLKMSRKKKIHVLLMFSLGSVACVTSIVRLKYLGEFEKSTDQTWDNVLPVMWSLIEICTAIICACLPALRALFAFHFPQLFSNDTAATSYYSKPSERSNNTAKSLVGVKTVVSKFSSQTGSHTVEGVEKAAIDSGATSPGERSSWFSKGSFITRDRQVVQDVEQGPGRHDTFEAALKWGNKNTITTKIWVENNDNHQSEFGHDHRTSHFNSDPASSSEDNLPRRSVARTESDYGNGIVPQMTRTGSEDSIFALDGPRESDDEVAILERRGRNEIELQNMSRPTTASRRSGSLSRGDRYDERGHVRRNLSLDLRGGQVKIPVSVFNPNPKVIGPGDAV